MKDRNDIPLTKGSIIDINQSVNGCNIFVVLSIDPLDIRYGYDLLRKYEYDKDDLLAPCKFTGDEEYDICENIYDGIIGLDKRDN